MKEPQKNTSDAVYALVGAVVVALIVCLIIAIVKPIVGNANEKRLARREAQVSVMKNFLKECADTNAVSTILLNGYLLDGKKQLRIEMALVYEVKEYNEYTLEGSYRYASQPKENRIALTGTCDLIGKNLNLLSDDGKEVFDLAFNEETGALEGNWSAYKNKRTFKKDPESFEKRLPCHLSN